MIQGISADPTEWCLREGRRQASQSYTICPDCAEGYRGFGAGGTETGIGFCRWGTGT